MTTGARSKPKPKAKASSAYKEARGLEVLQVAAQLFATQGIAKTTVRDIADAAGMLSGSLYYHFPSKEAMVDALMSRFQDHIWSRYDAVMSSEGTPRQKVEGVVRGSLEAIDQFNAEVKIFQNEGAFLANQERFSYMSDKSKRFRSMLTSQLQAGVEQGEFRADLNVELAFRFIRDSVWPVVAWFRPGGDLLIEEVIDEYLTMLFDGIAVPS